MKFDFCHQGIIDKLSTFEKLVAFHKLKRNTWDIPASQVIINEVGLRVYQHDAKEELVYNKESLLNPPFLVF